MANDVNELKRQLPLNISQYSLGAKTVWQVPSCREIFGAGSPPQIHGKIITSPADHGTQKRGRGLLTARHFQNGKPLDRVPSYGLMVYVSYPSALIFFDTDSPPFP